jgi:hypothetical protein
MADCYDWSFLFSLILKSQTMITQVISAIRIQDLSAQMFALQRGLIELETWADNEWFVMKFLSYIISLYSIFYSPGYKSLLLFVRNQAQALINQRRTFFPSSSQISPTKKQASTDQGRYYFLFFNQKFKKKYTYLDDDLFSLKQTTTDDNRPVSSRKKNSPHNRTISASDTNQPVSTFESLSINTQLTNNKTSRDTSPSIRTRRFSGDIVLPPSSSSEIIEPSLFSPGSVRARTITSIQENKNLSSVLNRQNSVSIPPVDPSPPPPVPSKRLDIRLSSGKTTDTSDFIHSDHQHSLPMSHLVNPHIEMSHDQQQQQTQLSNETARNKLLQSVYVNNSNINTSSSVSESLTNGTNYHTHTAESSSNCILS